jgi:hypothetical protein
MEQQQLFTHDVFQSSLNVAGDEADRWVESVVECLSATIPDISGHGLSYVPASSEFPYEHRELHINGIAGAVIDIPRLKIVPLGAHNQVTGLYVFLAANRPITDGDVVAWKTAIEAAIRHLSDENPEFQWAAALGQLNDPTSQKYALRKTFRFESMVVRSGRVQRVAIEQGSMPHFFASSFTLSWPVIVEGTAKGHNWLVASRQAAKDTHLVAALVSLAWNSTWKLIHSPQIIDHGELRIPQVSVNAPYPKRIPHPKTYKAIPKWASEAVEVVGKNSTISNALDSYYQGLLMQGDHPSYALVAFVAAIESIGKIIIGDKCSCCGKPNTSNQKFRAGLKAVVKDEAEVKRLANTYSSRSETAHEGKLHGNETGLGSIQFPSIFNPDSSDLFAFTDLLTIRQISRKILIQALRNQLRLEKIH